MSIFGILLEIVLKKSRGNTVVTVTELKSRINDHPTIRWIIQNGTTLNKGHSNNNLIQLNFIYSLNYFEFI